MAKKRIPVDTETYHYYNANSHNHKTCDCVVRAICTALDQTWEKTLKEMTELGLKYGRVFNEDWTINKYLESKGWKKQKQLRHLDNTKYTGSQFARWLVEEAFHRDTYARVVAHVGGHRLTMFVDGQIWDTWNSTGGCVGNYWIRIGGERDIVTLAYMLQDNLLPLDQLTDETLSGLREI